jgi:SRSO17 transposase
MIYRSDKTPMTGDISDYKEAPALHKVDETKWEAVWDRLVQKYHYLGYEGAIGARVKYLITLGVYIVGAISFCSAAYHLGPRDEYVGWDEATRLSMLPNLVSNNRFLILPWVSIRNLASKVLSMSLRRLREDWEKQYEVTPYMVETFVDREDRNYLGTCYKAANWVYLGVTKGYGKVGKSFAYHGKVKDIYIFVMDRQFAREFRPDLGRVGRIAGKDRGRDLLNKEMEELAAMMNGIPMWSRTLLEKIGVAGNYAEKIRVLFMEHVYTYTKSMGRKENKEHLVTMLQGLLSDLKRKTLEPIALAFCGARDVRNLTNFMTRSKWEDDRLREEYHADLSGMISAWDGMITGDESGIPKKGKESVGVARQYCGSLGKVDGCQVGVMLGYASSKGYGIIDSKLYMPKQWFEEGYAGKRAKCGVPSNVKSQTKNEILSGMIADAVRSGRFPAKYVGVDCAYGGDTNFLDSLPDGIIYFADVPSDTRAFRVRPDTFTAEYSGIGRKPTKLATLFAPLTVKTLAEDGRIPWDRVVLGIGAKGPIIAEDKVIPVVESRNGLPGKDVWLYVRKLEDGKIKYSLCSAPMDSAIEEIRKPALMRWSIEQCFNEGKEYLGMDQYETRSWIAWHRHMLLTSIAHLFILKLKTAFSSTPTSPSPTPHVDAPVSFEDYSAANDQMENNEPITHPSIAVMPADPQKFMTIGLIQKLICSTFIRTGEVLEEIDHMLYKAWSAFASHSTSRMKLAKAAYSSG